MIIAIIAIIVLLFAAFIGYKFVMNDFSFDGLFDDLFNFDSSAVSSDDDDDENKEDYEKALELLENKEYDKALKLFKELGDYEDSEDQVKKLEQWAKDYAAAVKLIEDGKPDEALEAFKKLGDYADAKEQTDKLETQVKYAAAKALADAADSESAWVAAADAYTALGDYEDAATKASSCYLEAAKCALLAGNTSSVDGYYAKLNDTDKATYDELPASVILTKLEESLSARKALQNSDIWDDYTEELSLLRVAQSINCSDSRLMQLLNDYITAVEAEQNNENNNGDDYILIWYQQEYNRSVILDALAQEYSFLADNSSLYDWCIGQTDACYTNYTIENALYNWYSNATVQYNYSYGNYYVSYYNSTEYNFNVEFTFYYYDSNGNQISSETIRGSANAYGNYTLTLDAPSNFSIWNATYAFYL